MQIHDLDVDFCNKPTVLKSRMEDPNFQVIMLSCLNETNTLLD